MIVPATVLSRKSARLWNMCHRDGCSLAAVCTPQQDVFGGSNGDDGVNTEHRTSVASPYDDSHV